jgi:quaternary ammonium compound-resistance protein SugE
VTEAAREAVSGVVASTLAQTPAAPTPWMNPWIMLVVAGLLEVVWASGMKSTQGFTKLWPSVLVIVAMIASFTLLAQAMKFLPAGTSYAIWVGIGAVGVAIFGMVWLKEPATAWRIGCILLILLGVLGLKLR